MLSDHEIERFRTMGAIVVEPWRPEALNPNSYDLTVGPFVARYRRTLDGKLLTGYLRPGEVAGPEAFEIEDCSGSGVITLDPGESILAHTNEFVGGTTLVSGIDHTPTEIAINTQLRATSTAGRWGLTACRCAGHGDAGYFDRWTLEVQNNGPRALLLPVGAVICQIVFFRVATPRKLYQEASGNYQSHRNLEKLMSEWTPTKMLPKKLKVLPRSSWEKSYASAPSQE